MCPCDKTCRAFGTPPAQAGTARDLLPSTFGNNGVGSESCAAGRLQGPDRDRRSCVLGRMDERMTFRYSKGTSTVRHNNFAGSLKNSEIARSSLETLHP